MHAYGVDSCPLCPKRWSPGHVCDTEDLKRSLAFYEEEMRREPTLAEMAFGGVSDMISDKAEWIRQELERRGE